MTQDILEYIYAKRRNFVILAVAFLILTSLFMLITPQGVGAQSTKPTNDMKTSFKKLCDGLEDIKTTASKAQFDKYCKTIPTTSAKMNSAANDICDNYGGNRLEKQCDDYRSKNNVGGGPLTVSTLEGKATHQCGKGENAVKTKFNFGCAGNSYKGSSLNPILDVAYTIIRFLSVGVGIAVVGSIIWAGILYSSSQGNPEQTQAAKNRIRDSVIGLILYLFIFALVQYLVPGGLFT